MNSFIAGYLQKTAGFRDALYNFSVVEPDSWIQRHAPAPTRAAIRLMQSGIGRLATNTVIPTGYDVRGHMTNKPGVSEVIKAMISDEPSAAVAAHPDAAARNAQFRLGFGLNPNIPGWNKNIVTVPGSGTGAAGDAPAVLEPRYRTPDAKRGMRAAIPSAEIPGSMWTLWAGNTRIPKPGEVIDDPFDYRLHPDEKLDSVNNVARLLISPWVNAARVRMRSPGDVVASK